MTNRDLPPEVKERTRPEYWYRRANIPKAMWSTDWQKFAGTGAEEAAEVAFELGDAWVNEDEYRGIALFGKPGRGKTTVVTTLLCSVLDALRPTTIHGMFSEDVQCYFLTLDDYHYLHLRAYELDRLTSRSPYPITDAIDEWTRNFALRTFIETEVPHLVLDDVGNEHQTATGAVVDEFHRLIRLRYRSGLSTSITSNLTQEEFANSYGEPQLSFIHEAAQVMLVGGDDHRRRRRAR